ncbi:MAG TPA: alpha-N-arabinofuranosidase [Terriglobales bacterium]|nr:alpha-N-arabinofuranosidase [Terriglobales bacterium]
MTLSPIATKLRVFALIGTAIALSCWSHAQVETHPSPIVATVDATQVKEPISKYMYGMFIEHIGNLINHSLWSEMLDDRKFYFSIDSKPEPQPSGAPNAIRQRMQYKKWRPIGPDEFITMDATHAFVGEHSPEIKLEVATPHGIQQSGLVLRKGKSYVGRIYLAGTPAAKVKVNLVWGTGTQDRQEITAPTLHSGYARFPLKFTAQSDSDNARLEIVGAGTGSFHIGTVSLMPADNVHGFRSDTIAVLRQLNSGFWRLPGGNFLSDYDWHVGIGDPDKRPPTWDYAWNAMQPNDVGMDELMEMCKLLGVEPYITVNAGLGGAESAAEEVEYINGSTNTRMGALRARNGHPVPYHVKYWNVGNEPYGFWEIGWTPLRYWVIKHRDFVKAMRAVDPSITILASGAMPDEMTVTGNARMATGKVIGEFGTDADWTGGLFSKCWGTFDGVTEHWYARSGTRFDLDIGQHDPYTGGTTMPPRYGYVPVKQSLIEWSRVPSNRVRVKAEEWGHYQEQYPAIKDKKIFLSIDEWAYTGSPTDLKLALAYAMVLQEMFRHTGFLKMSAFTMGVSTINFNATEASFNTTGLMFKLYRDHFGTIPVEVSGNSPQPAPKWPVGGEQPATSPGSPTYPLDISAAFTVDHKFLTVAVVNATEEPQSLSLNIKGVHATGGAKMWEMTGASPDAANVLSKAPEVQVTEKVMPASAEGLSVPPVSICLYQFATESVVANSDVR